MKRVSTHFLRFVLVLMGLGALLLCIFALPSMWNASWEGFPLVRYASSLIMIGLYATAIPFFICLWQTFKLLRYIDENTAFSNASVQALRTIKRCAIIISALYILGVPLLFPIADADDAPGILPVGAAIACGPIAIAVLTTILQRLLKSAIDMKSENDLTV